MKGFSDLNTAIGKGINSAQNDAERHWSPHIIIANLYPHLLRRRVKLTAQIHILA